MSSSNRLEETRAHVLDGLREIALAANSRSISLSRLEELDEQLVAIINGSGFIECDGGHGPGITISPKGEATVVQNEAASLRP